MIMLVFKKYCCVLLVLGDNVVPNTIINVMFYLQPTHSSENRSCQPKNFSEMVQGIGLVSNNCDKVELYVF